MGFGKGFVKGAIPNRKPAELNSPAEVIGFIVGGFIAKKTYENIVNPRLNPNEKNMDK